MLLKKTKNNKGFTLIEVLIAMSIISIVTFSFYTITNSSIKQNSKNEKDIKSLNVAQSELESLRKEIKSSSNEISIYDQNGVAIIEIPDDDEIIWEVNGLTQKIKIKEDGIYSQYIGYDEGTEVLQYNRSIEGDPTEYLVKLNLSREKKASKYLYTIEVKVKATNSFSKKETVLNTNVLSK